MSLPQKWITITDNVFISNVFIFVTLMILIWHKTLHNTHERLFHGTNLLLAHWITDKIAQMGIITVSKYWKIKKKAVYNLAFMIPSVGIHCEEGRLRKGQDIINSHASTLSAQEQRLPIKPSLWQSWLLQNTISYCFSILGQRTRATGMVHIDHTLRDTGEISSECVYSQMHFCYVFLYFSGG